MPTTLQQEIRQRKPFTSLHEEANLNIVRTNAVVQEAYERLFKEYGISPAQYNVLRILRGAGPEGLCRNEIRDRLLTRMPDVTRLLDRMEEAGLVTRTRSTEDRRQVPTRLTERGRELVESLGGPVARLNRRRLRHLTDQQLRTLIELLTLARQEA